MAKTLPRHLRKYIVTQNYEKYTALDQAVWRYILRQLKAFLSRNAHESYLEGLEQTKILTETIPRIDDISKALENFGWRALPVSGFIPPAAFMELQARGVLPIASELRTLEHLTYTPAPDIVHEAAGHAPLLIHPEFSRYLREYAVIAQKAIMSREDLDVYEAIRVLSDIKENPLSKPSEIKSAQDHLDKVVEAITHVSEAAELARMNWWTAEYGLIGTLEHPKIYGAGLLSSVGEAKWCLSDQVKKIPMSIRCLETSYDITEPQPQLFVTPSFEYLTEVLHEMAQGMAFQKGGTYGLSLAKKSRTINSIELNSGLQVGGVVDSFEVDAVGTPIYFKLSGPCQLAIGGEEIPGHSRHFHSQGFSSPVGFLKNSNRCLSQFSVQEFAQLGASIGSPLQLEFDSGIKVYGIYQGSYRNPHTNQLVLVTFSDCTVTGFGKKLFEPHWGSFDMAVGSQIVSVFGGAPDRETFGETEDFVASRVPARRYTPEEKVRHSRYQWIRDQRNTQNQLIDWAELDRLVKLHEKEFSQDWLWFLEVVELYQLKKASDLQSNPYLSTLGKFKSQSQIQSLIDQGLQLIK